VEVYFCGQQVDISIMECLVASHQYTLTWPVYSGSMLTRPGWPGLRSPISIYACKDGYINLRLQTIDMSFLGYLFDMPQLADDPRFRAPNDRYQHRKELEAITQEKEDLGQQLSYNQKTFDNVSSQLVLEKGAKFRFQDELKPIKNENAILRRQLKSLSTSKIKLENQLRQLKEEKSELERRLNEIELFLQDRFSRKKDIESIGQPDTGRNTSEIQITSRPAKESIELPPIVVRPQTALTTAVPSKKEEPAVEENSEQVFVGGSVLGVNKEGNFVIIDLGKNAGVKSGDTLKVYREGKAVASIEIIEVRESISACDIREEIKPIEVGDTVR